ncbi:MAG: DUF5110 domain-containing protein [Bacilli bacterium]|nr:DUF5110 domain-containing protein [Bacilli bacterium]
MAELSEKFKPNYQDALANEKAIYKGKNYRFTVLSESLIRLEYDSSGKFEDRPTELAKFRNFPVPKFEVQENDTLLVISTEYFRLQYQKEQVFQGPMFAQDSYLKVSLNDSDKSWYYKHDEARNFKGFINNLETREEYVSQTDKILEEKNKKNKKKLIKTTYSLKGLYSTDGFVSLDDSKSLIIDEQGYLQKDERPRIDIYLFMYKRDFGRCLKDYFTLSGYPPLIPRYALGIWWNKTKPYSMQDVRDLIQDFNKHEIPLSILLLGENWHIKDKNNIKLYKSGFTFNPEFFTKPEELTTYLHDRGIRLGVNIDPAEGIHTHERNYDELASSLGIREKQIIPFNAYDKKFISEYLVKLITPLYNNGVDFFWIDYYPRDRKLLNVLNYYHYNDFKKMDTARPLLLSRINDVAPHNILVHYSGESTVGWDSLNKIPVYNSLGSNLGLSWWSHDIGGYKNGIEDKELYIRYVELGTFSPIFRFSSETGHYYKRKPWKWDVNTYTIVSDYCKLRHRLIPYLYGEAYKYHKSGLPLIQPLYYAIPEIYDEKEFQNEYFFGTELLVAPITKPADKIMQRSVEKIYLPPGTWYDFKTGKKFIGDKRYYLFFKQEDYPVFAKSGSIICLGDLEENINVTNAPKTMEVHVFPGKSNIYNLYEDDGYSNLYKDGYYIVTRFDYNYLENDYNLIIRPFEGKSKIIPDKRNYRIRFRNTREPRDVQVLQENTDIRFEKNVEENDFVIDIKDVDTTKQITIICRGQNIEIDAKRIVNDDIDSIISDLQIPTSIKNEIADIMFGKIDIARKRIYLKKLKNKGLDSVFIKMFLKLLDYIKEI